MIKRVIIFIGIILLSSLISASSITIESERADNISGYICEDSEKTRVPLILTFEKTDPDPEQEIYNLDIQKDIENNKGCEIEESSFSFNINIFSLSEEDQQRILKKFPIVKLTIQSSSNIETIYNLDFSCIYENQTIIKLTRPFNSHVYLGNQSTLEQKNIPTYPICYERVFGYPYEGEEELYPSNCNNPLFYKYQQENSHISTTNSGYPYKTCYADLTCTKRISPLGANPCINEEKQVTSLFYETNTHISDRLDNNYKIKICCKTNYKPNPFSEAKWQNMLNQEITKTNNCSWVQLMVWGENIKNIESNVNILKEKDIIYSRKITIPEIKRSNLSWQTSFSGNYEFNATLENSLQSVISNELNVQGELIESPDYNIQLIEPLCGKNFTIGQPIEFKIFINTSYLLVNGVISFGDGNYSSFSNVGSSISTFSHKYETDGTKLIAIETRPANSLDSNCPDLSYLTKRKIINLILINESKSGKYAAACIDSPEDMSKIKEATVLCNASSTRAVDYDSSGKYTEIPKENLSFEWKFNDNTIHKFQSILNNTCYDTLHEYKNSDGSVYNQRITCLTTTKPWLFTKYFQQAGESSAELIVKLLEPAIESSEPTETSNE